MPHVQENSNSTMLRIPVPKCLDLCTSLWGHTTQDRGTLLSSGGHHREHTPSHASHDTPQDMSLDPLGVQSGGQSSKRSTREYSVNSTPSKKSASVDDCLNDLTDIIKDRKLQ
jgi:hypothetical protein